MGMSLGYATALGMENASPVTKGFEFLSCTLTKTGEIVDSSGLRGSRSHRSERTRAGNYGVAGQITMNPSPEELALILPFVMGANASGTTYALGETLTAQNIVVDKVAKVATYAGCKINRATFSGSAGQPLQLVLDVVGTTETLGNAGTFPSVTYQNTAPLMFSDGAFTMVSSSRSVNEFTLTIDNALQVANRNSVTATDIYASDRTVSFECSTPYTSSETDLYDQAVAGAAATIAFTYANYSLSFALAALQVPAVGPTVDGRGEVALRIAGVSRMSSTTRELVITLDSTP